MKILALSDKVVETVYSERIRQKYGDVDLVVGCGDLPYHYLEYVVSMLDKPTLYVRGNHDSGIQYTYDGRRLTIAQGADLIEDKLVHLKGLLFLGLGGSMRYKPDATEQYTEGQMRARVRRLLPALLFNRIRRGRFVDVLVAHAPPYHIHDRADLPHKGFKTFLSFMSQFKPRYLLHGHAHIWRNNEVRETIFQETRVINVYPVRLLDINSPEVVR